VIQDFCSLLRKALKETIEARRDSLEHGAPTRDLDERMRGEIRGIRIALMEIDSLEMRANKNDD